MNIKVENYLTSKDRLPTAGQHILGFQDEDSIVVYQAYNSRIADFAVKKQFLGGSHFNYGRMSWIKPNFLWMMYRCGWAEKENQERVLALWVGKTDFEEILDKAVLSSFNPGYYDNREHWKQALNAKNVRLQWDPDHDPYGKKLTRRAIQLGLKDEALEKFGKQQIKLIEDITDFVKEQKRFVDRHQLEKLLIPIENIFRPTNSESGSRIGVQI